MKTDIEKAIYSVYKNCTFIKDVHDAAYLSNEEYRKFWDWHSTEDKEKLLKSQRLMTFSNKTGKIQEGVFHLATCGLTLLAKKLIQIGKPTRKEQIQLYVTSKDFTNTMRIINIALTDITNEVIDHFSNIAELANKEADL